MGHGLPESEEGAEGTPRPRLFHELVRIIDAMARKMEREERLLAMNGGVLNETLGEAVRVGGVKDVRLLLAQGADATAENGIALRYACLHGYLAVAEALMESGAAFTQRCLNLSQHNAASRGHTACCVLMLDHGADVQYNDDLPLCYAARHGQLQMMVTLLLDEARMPGRRGRCVTPCSTTTTRSWRCSWSDAQPEIICILKRIAAHLSASIASNALELPLASFASAIRTAAQPAFELWPRKQGRLRRQAGRQSERRARRSEVSPAFSSRHPCT